MDPESGASETPKGGANAERKPRTRAVRAWPKRAALAAGRWFMAAYFTADPRSLGVFRIALGLLLFGDLARRWPDLLAHYTNEGWLTNHFALFRPMSNYLFSIYLAFSTPGEVKVMFAIHLLVCLFLLVGWRTRLMHVLAAILTASINTRNILLENGGYVVLTLLVVWSAFLPTGRRYSVDAFLESWRRRRERSPEALNQPLAFDTKPVVSLAVFALILQWTVIYAFNVIHKSGAPWRDGTAVHYFFEQDRMVTALGAWVRARLTLGTIQAMTWGALAAESLIALLLVFPFGTRYTRMVAWLLCLGLHLSIDSVVQLGPFSYAMMAVFFIFIPAEFWNGLDERRRKRRQPRTWLYDKKDGFSLELCRVIRRFDGLGLVRFASATDSEPGAEGDARSSLWLATVADARNEVRWSGRAALTHLFDALAWPRSVLHVTRLPGIRRWADRLLEANAEARNTLSRAFGLEHVPAESDRVVERSAFELGARRAAFVGGQLLLVVLLVAETSQVLIENRAIPQALKPKERPPWMEAIVVYPRLFQGWSMFAPGPPMGDGRIVVDGRTADGRSLDPLTGKPPTFDMEAPGGFQMDQIWGDFHRRIAENRFSAYHQGLRDMLANYHRITGIEENRLVAFDVWYINQNTAPPGRPHEPTTRRLLFSHPRKK